MNKTRTYNFENKFGSYATQQNKADEIIEKMDICSDRINGCDKCETGKRNVCAKMFDSMCNNMYGYDGVFMDRMKALNEFIDNVMGIR